MTSDPAESFGKGLGKAVLDKLDEKTKQLIQQFKERKIAFIQNPQTIEAAKEQKNTSEYQNFQQYIVDEKFKLSDTLRFYVISCLLFSLGSLLKDQNP